MALKLLRYIAACLITILLILSLCLFLIVDQEPHAGRLTRVTPEHIERLKQTLDHHRHRIQRNRQKQRGTITFHSEDVDIAINYLVKHFVRGQASIRTANRNATLQVSIPLSMQIITGYVNVKATLIETDTLPQLRSITFGHIPIPDFISQSLITYSTKWLRDHPKYNTSINTIQQVQISADTLAIRYQWQGGSGQSSGYFSVLSKSEQNRVRRYYNLLRHRHQKQTIQTLSEILHPLIETAAKFSQNNPAPQENRAAILATTFYIMGLPLKYLIPEAVNEPVVYRPTVVLDGRQDFAQHFIISAAITAYSDTILSDAIGLYKEIEDKRSGSGFSFNDIAADRAGTRFGARATASHPKAAQLQQWVVQGLEDKDLMPEWADLPESLSKTAFKQRYGNLGSPTYKAMMSTIEQRVAALPFLN